MRFPKTIAVLSATWLTVFCAAVSRPAAQGASTPGDYKAPPAPEQPIAYNHKLHLAQGLECRTCHETAETGDRATLPPTATCMRCHARVKTDSADVQKLAAFDSRKEDVPWRRVYRLAEYVYFSHKVHLASDKSVTCQTCHGNVREMEVMQKVKDTSMAACIECHKQHSAPVKCDTCHEPRGATHEKLVFTRLLSIEASVDRPAAAAASTSSR